MFKYYTGEYINIPTEFNYINEDEDLWGVITPQNKIFPFNFKKLISPFKELAKEFILVNIIDNRKNKISTLANKYKLLNRFLTFVQEYCLSLEEITSDIMLNFLDFEDNETNDDLYKTTLTVENFFNYYKEQFDTSINEFALIELINFKKNYATINKYTFRWRSLPDRFVSDFIYYLILDIKNKQLSPVERIYSCILLIQTQIGVRISELENLEYDSIINEVNLQTGNVFEYKNFKSATKSGKFKKVKSVLNPLALYYWLYLIKLTEPFRPENEKRLFILPYDTNNKFRNLQAYIIHFCTKYSKELNIINNPWYSNYMRSKSVSEISSSCNTKDLKPTDKINYPLCHQFRAYRISWLLNKKVDIDLISSTVGHADKSMTYGYYDGEAIIDQKLRDNNYGQYSTETLNLLRDVANIKAEKLDIANKRDVPNGECYCPFKCDNEDYINKRFK